jgi:hypothetical protein
MKAFFRSLLAIYLLLSSYFFINLMNFDYNVGKFLIQNNKTVEVTQSIFNGLPQYTPYSRAVIKAYNEQLFPRNCDNYNYFADKLFEINNRNPQTHYFRAACKEISGDLPGAIVEMYKAHSYEKANSEYLLALSILYFNSNDFNASKKYFLKSKMINPNNKDLKILEELLERKIDLQK